MAEKYDNTNGGALFPNDRKDKPTHPTLGVTSTSMVSILGSKVGRKHLPKV